MGVVGGGGIHSITLLSLVIMSALFQLENFQIDFSLSWDQGTKSPDTPFSPDVGSCPPHLIVLMNLFTVFFYSTQDKVK